MKFNKWVSILSPLLFTLRNYTTAFQVKPLIRYYSNSQLLMRSKKNGDFDNNVDAISQRRMKNISPVYKPKSSNQEFYVKCLNDPSVPIVFGIGPAGCGKTLFACITAVHELKKGNINKIILTRPIVPVEEEEIGFLPGSLIAKMDPWTRPIFDILLEFYQQRDLDSMVQTGVIEISPLAYMRGRTFKNCFIIADEMQNSTPNQMLMLTTRIGDHSKMVVTGDLKQSDRCENNGLLDFIKKMATYKSEVDGIRMVHMNTSDIERSPIVAKILDIYNHVPKHDFVSDSVERVISGPNVTNHHVETDNKKLSPVTRFVIENDAAMIPMSHLHSKFL